MSEPRITRRRAELLVLLARGMSDREIAAELRLSPHTVKRNTGDVYRTLGARGRVDAVVAALRAGFIRLTDDGAEIARVNVPRPGATP